ncbi:hypothetical protein [Oxynema aestuarii]|nr:hypothetical protein [Oxynema aestuarii]
MTSAAFNSLANRQCFPLNGNLDSPICSSPSGLEREWGRHGGS